MSRALKIGNIELKYRAMPAPLASLTDIVFRKLLDEIGYVDYMVTEMISAEGLRRLQGKTLGMIQPADFKSPQLIQLFGSEPQAFVDAVKYIENETQFAGIDINMGCPANKVIRRGAGSALLTRPDQAAAIVRAIKQNTRLPLTVKIRLGYNQENVGEMARVLEGEGIDALAVHFRLRSDAYRGEAKWQYAPLVRDIIKQCVLIGNGDIRSSEVAQQRLQMVDAVMIGRGAVENPLIFAEIATAAGDIKGKGIQREWVIMRLVQLIEEHYPLLRRLPRLRAYARFLFSFRQHSKKIRQKIYTADSFTQAKQLLSEILTETE